jgi:membrane-bound acyltransferase YfiQ involved in biofilm formation
MSNEKDVLLERAKFFRDHVATVLNLATGSLVLSVTFLHDQAGHLKQSWLVRRSWWFLFIAIFFGVAYNYVLNAYVREEGVRYGFLLKLLSGLFHATFVVAVCYLLRFGLWNL